MWFSSEFRVLRQRIEQLQTARPTLPRAPHRLVPGSDYWLGAGIPAEVPAFDTQSIHLADEPLWTRLLTEQRPAWRWQFEQYGDAFWREPPQAILFDLDGTLIDSFDGILELFLAVLSDMGRAEVGDDAVRPLIGRPLDECFACFLTAPDVPRAVFDYRERYAACMLEVSPPFPGSEALLQRLRATGVKVGIVSNKSAAAVRTLVAGHGWNVDAIYGEGEGILPKPAPDLILAALDALQVRPGQALYVGDSTLDAAASHAAGTAFVALASGAHAAPELAAGACGSFPSMNAFARALGFPPGADLPQNESA